MTTTNTTKHSFGKTILAAALALGIGVLPLAACGGQSAQGDAAPAATSQESSANTAELDATNWKTLGDALATKTDDDLSYGFDDTYFACVFRAGEARVRAVAKVTPDLSSKLSEISFEDPDRDQKVAEVLSGLELVSVEDISGQQLTQEQLDSYVGKTGQDLLDAGFGFSSYSFYGGEQTGATMDYGFYSYEVTYDTTVPEEQTEDGGAALLDATVVSIESFGNLSNMALDPANVE